MTWTRSIRFLSPVTLFSLVGALFLAPTVRVRQTVPGARGQQIASQDIHKIKHVVVIMQENRSFDSYFGTYQGANGIPMHNGEPAVCVPDPRARQCVKPYHDPHDLNRGGPHGQANAASDMPAGRWTASLLKP
jgi:hypothetical protein